MTEFNIDLPIFKDVLSIADAAPDLNSIFTDEGMFISSMFPSGFYGVEVTIPKDKFNKYELSKDRHMSVDYKALMNTLKSKVEKVEATLSSTLRIQMGSRLYDLKLIAIDEPKPIQFQKVKEFPCKITLKSDTLHEIVSETEKTSSYIEFEVGSDYVRVKANSDLMDYERTILGDELMKVECDKPVKFRMKNEQLLETIPPSGELVTLKTGSTIPVVIDFTYKGIPFKSFIAPILGDNL